LKRYPKKLYNLEYPARVVYTKEGWYPEEGEEYPKGRKRHYGVQRLTVDATAYPRFPRKERTREVEGIEEPALFEIVRSGVPIEEKELVDWTEESVVSSLRTAFGAVTWKEATEETERVREKAAEEFEKEDGALIEAGFVADDLRLVIENIHLPPELEEALPDVDRQRLEAEAAKFESIERAEETIGSVIQMMVRATGKPVKEVQETIEKSTKLKKEFRDFSKNLIERRMAIDSKSFLDIRVEGAEGLEKTLLNLIGAWKRMPSGENSSGEGKRSPEKNTSKRSKATNITEEARETAEKRGGHLAVVASLTGTEGDVQNLQEQRRKLEEAGCIVMPSNYQAALLAVEIMKEVGAR
jgi:hypothetical protein